MNTCRPRSGVWMCNLVAVAMVLAGLGLPAETFAQVVPCADVHGRIPEDLHEHHTTADAQNRVPVVPNELNGTVRTWNVLGPNPTADPCAGYSYIAKDQQGVYRWVTDAAPGAPAPFTSECFSPLVYMDYSASSTYPPVVEIAGLPNGTTGRSQMRGFGLKVSLLSQLAVGDFLPAGPTIAESSLALVPPGMGGAPTAWMGLGRQTLQSSVDLTTGAPLIKVTDLELPFDGATFRLTRTRAFLRGPNEESPHSIAHGSNSWWAWTGLGWMVGENPLLLLDSAVPNQIGDNPRTTRLILDAHTSIPFQLIEADGRYEAPPRFRATLRHNGVWSTSNHTWDVPPTQYDIALYEGAVKYTFVAIREDVPENEFHAGYLLDGLHEPLNAQASYHERPFLPNQFLNVNPPLGAPFAQHDPFNHKSNRGFGIPYYALCKKITDRYGHEVEMEYARSYRRHIDDPETEDCIECQQDGMAKGQLKWIKLRSGGSVRWTLLYSHRRFAGLRWALTDETQPATLYDMVSNKCPSEDPGRYELHGDSAIDRIYVFEGDVQFNDDDIPALTVHHTELPGYDDDFSTSDPHDRLGGLNLPPWKYQVRYHYDFMRTGQYYTSPELYPLVARYPWMYGWDANAAKGPPVLLMTSVLSRAASSGAAPEVQHQVYVYRRGEYDPPSEEPFNDRNSQIPWLHAILGPRDVEQVLSHRFGPAETQWTLNLRQLAFRHEGSTGWVSPAHIDAALEFAYLRLDPGNVFLWPTAASYDRPTAESLAPTDGGPRITRAGSRSPWAQRSRAGRGGDGSSSRAAWASAR